MSRSWVIAAMAACLLGACVVAPIRPPPPPPPPVPVAYRYFGPHPIPDGAGGGWCPVDGLHFHPYMAPPAPYWTYNAGAYYFAGPPMCSFGGPHPVPGGGWCFIGYPHSHNYCPTAQFVTYYHWDPAHRVYLYAAPPPSYHGPGALYVAPRTIQPGTTFHRAEP